MKKLAVHFSSAGLLLSTLVTQAFAQITQPDPIDGMSDNVDITEVILSIIEIILNVVLIIAVLFLIIAGVRLIISSGDEGEKDKAKKTIIYVIAGIVVIVFARALVIFVADAFATS